MQHRPLSFSLFCQTESCGGLAMISFCATHRSETETGAGAILEPLYLL